LRRERPRRAHALAARRQRVLPRQHGGRRRCARRRDRLPHRAARRNRRELTRGPMTPRRPKVLIVDGEDAIVLALHRVLYQDNPRYDVLLARSAEIAQEIIADTRVDVLVTDVHLPDKSGMDLLGWVAAEAPSTRVIVMTAFDVGGIKDRAHAFGCL